MSKKEVVIKNKNHDDVLEQNWQEVEDIYMVIAESIVDIGAKVNDTAAAANVLGIDTDPELVVAFNGLATDLDKFADDLVAVHEKHSSKTGIISTEDDYVLSVNVFNEYLQLQDRFRSIIFNPMLTITEKVSVAKNEVKENVNAA